MNVNAQLAHMGRLHLQAVHGLLLDASPNPEESEQLMAMLAEPGAIWVDHVTDREEFHGVGANLDRFAAGAGYRRELLNTVPDSNGRPVFEVFRFKPSAISQNRTFDGRWWGRFGTLTGLGTKMGHVFPSDVPKV